MSKDKKFNLYKKTFIFYKKYILMFIVFILLTFLASGMSVLNPIFEGHIVSEFTEFNFNNIVLYALIYLAIRLVAQIVNYINTKVLINLNTKVRADIKRSLVYAVSNLEVKNYDKSNSGVFISRINSDANELANFYNMIAPCLCDILSNIGFMFYIMFVNIWVFLYVVVYIVTIYLIESKRINIRFKNRKKFKEANEKVVGSYSELIRGIRDVKALNLKKEAIAVTEDKQNKAIEIDKKCSNINNNWNRFKNIFTVRLDIAFILMCAFLIKHNLMNPATFFVVYIYTGRVNNLVRYVIQIKEYLNDGKLAGERVFEILDNNTFTKEYFGTTTLTDCNGNIKFNNVSFAYDNQSKLFTDLNFEIPQNKTIALVGKSGQGKSTILQLINRMYDIKSGEILLDDINITQLTEDSLRDNVSIVMQTPYIFNTSIYENLTLVNPNATQEQIEDACKKAEIHDFIQGLENKYKSVVGENGVQLSGGQKQRLAIARALLKNSKILLFDEATSALDNESQGKIKNVISNLKSDHTIIIVAHRLSTVVDCDEILVLDNNQIIAKGNHKYLMEHCATYKELYEIEND